MIGSFMALKVDFTICEIVTFVTFVFHIFQMNTFPVILQMTTRRKHQLAFAIILMGQRGKKLMGQEG